MSAPDTRIRDMLETSTPLETVFCLNAFPVLDTQVLSWPIRTYRVIGEHGQGLLHKDRGAAKGAVFKVRKDVGRGWGYGFVVDISSDLVVVPERWDIPASVVINGLKFVLVDRVEARADQVNHRLIVEGILREAVRKHFKESDERGLGLLWRDFKRYCEMPSFKRPDEPSYCRSYDASIKVLAKGQWAIVPTVQTVSIDSSTLGDYFSRGDADELARRIEAKRANRQTRDGEETAVRVWYQDSESGSREVEVLQLRDPDEIIAQASLAKGEQSAHAASRVSCERFPSGIKPIPLNQLRLILDTQITQGRHTETIISPAERVSITTKLRDYLDGMDAFGKRVRLGREMLSAKNLYGYVVSPPAVRVRGEGGKEKVLQAPKQVSGEAWRDRAASRRRHVIENGYLQRRDIKPALAWPTPLGDERGRRMKTDLDEVMQDQGLPYRFDIISYRNVEEIQRAVEQKGFDCLLAVLPEGSHNSRSDRDTHEQIKQRIPIPSQCIQHNNTLAARWWNRSHQELADLEPRYARRIRQRYELCVLNLLVKFGFVPFAPADPFYYNVQIGLDVGGQFNNEVMACIGYGFAEPKADIVFLPGSIHVDRALREPIPEQDLYRGLLKLIERLRMELVDASRHPNFDRIVFYRDGRMLGSGDDWSERNALTMLHQELRTRGWVSENATWTVAELMKDAEGFRLFSLLPQPDNPIVGQCVFTYDDDRVILIATTGRPYLSQGTAAPLKVKVSDIAGKAVTEEIVQDLVWQADIGFTKPDMGTGLPWVLHVADSGALQLSRDYLVSGITV